MTHPPDGGQLPIVIVGGGMAALAAAYELSKPGWDPGQQPITVYVQGHRLGGKAASSRNREFGNRIEEHGLHIWFGYYENAFRMMARCFDELHYRKVVGGEPRWSTALGAITDGFQPASVIGLADDAPDTSWSQWHTVFPDDDAVPWDREDDDEVPLFDLWWYLPRLGQRTTALLHAVMQSFLTDAAPSEGVDLADLIAETDSVLGRFDPELARLFDAAAQASNMLRLLAAADSDSALVRLALAQLAAAEQLLRYIRQVRYRSIGESEATRRLVAVVELLIGVTRGLLRHGVTSDSDLDDLDAFEMSDWLSANGVSFESRESPLVRALTYCLPFAYPGGNRDAPEFSAGVGIRLFLRTFFTYRGALMWKMRFGMGEVVFAPLFELLVKRGVHFRFGHQLVSLTVSEDGRRVSSLGFRRSAGEGEGEGQYERMLERLELADGTCLRSWRVPVSTEPAIDDESLIGVVRTATWEAPVTDAKVLLAVPLEVLSIVARPLFDASPLWCAAEKSLATVPTLAVQLWLERPADEALGWPPGITVSGFTEPLDTFADMSHLTASENNGRSGPAGLVYLCSAFHDSPKRPWSNKTRTGVESGPGAGPCGVLEERQWLLSEDGHAASAVLSFLRDRAAFLWPGARRFDGRFDITVLYGCKGDALPDTGAQVDERADIQLQAQLRHLLDEARTPGFVGRPYFRANVQPSDRYTLSLPGGVKDRLHPAHTGFVDLYVAGDWTWCVLNAGCIEAATMSGMLAAEAISGRPMQIIGRSR